jgi:hypothetical protein
MPRVALALLCAAAVLMTAEAAHADTSTRLPFFKAYHAESQVWLAVDPVGQHVFVSGGPGTSVIVVLDYSGAIVMTLHAEHGASEMAMDTATHTVYAALPDDNAIALIDTNSLSVRKFVPTTPFENPSSLAIAGGKLWFTCFRESAAGCPGLVEADLDGSHMTLAPIAPRTYEFATDMTSGGPGSKYLALGETDLGPPTVHVYDVSGGTPSLVSYVWDPAGDCSSVRDMTFDPSAVNLLLACGAPNFLESLATTTLQPSGRYPTDFYPISVAVSADGKYVAGGLESVTGPDLFLFDDHDSAPIRTWQVGDGNASGIKHSLAFSPDATRIFDVVADSASGHLVFHVLAGPDALSPTKTSLSCAPHYRTVHPGNRAFLRARVSGVSSGTVDLYATVAGASKELVDSAPLIQGTASFSVKPSESTSYVAELEQGSTWTSSTSQDVTVRVAPLVGVSVRPLGLGVHDGYHEVETELTATNPTRPGEPLRIVVERRSGRAWRLYRHWDVRPTGDGVARAILFTSSRAARFRVKAVYAGDTDFAASASAWKTFAIR